MEKKYIWKNYLIIIMLLLSTLILAKNNIIKYVGYGSIIFLTLFYFIKAIERKIPINFSFLIILFFILYNIIILIIGFSRKSLYLVTQEIILIIFLFAIMNIKITEKMQKCFTSAFTKIFYVSLALVLIINLLGKEQQFKLIMSTTIYKVIFVISFFALSNSKNKFLVIIISSVSFFILGERTSAVILVLMYCSNILLKKINKKSTYKLVFVIYAIILILIPREYVKLQYKPIGKKLNTYSREISGENFFSGRNILWEIIFNSLKGYEMFGLTYNNNILASNKIFLSTHNLYIWLQLNGGYFLLILFLLLLYSIWIKYSENIKNEKIRWAALYLLGFMLLANFELIWLTNNFIVSLYMWFVIGINLNNNKKEKLYINKTDEIYIANKINAE